MNKLGDVDVDRLEEIKAELFEKAADPLINDAYLMIVALERLAVTAFENHQHYVKWAVKQMHPNVDSLLTQSDE